MRVACLHTAERDVTFYEGLFAAQNFAGQLRHSVRPDLLNKVQAEGRDASRAEVLAAMEFDAKAKVVLCTCTTLSPLIGSQDRHLNVIGAAVEAACRIGPRPLIAACRPEAIEMTCRAVLARNPQMVPRRVLAPASPDHGALIAAIGDDIRNLGTPDSILLAQVSLRGAAGLLQQWGVPVLTTPDLAVQAALQMASH